MTPFHYEKGNDCLYFNALPGDTTVDTEMHGDFVIGYNPAGGVSRAIIIGISKYSTEELEQIAKDLHFPGDYISIIKLIRQNPTLQDLLNQDFAISLTKLG